MHMLHTPTRLVEYLQHLVARWLHRYRSDDIGQMSVAAEFHEKQEFGLTVVRLLFANGSCREELDDVWMTREFFLCPQVKEIKHLT